MTMDFKKHSSVFELTGIEYNKFIYYRHDDEENGVDSAYVPCPVSCERCVEKKFDGTV